LYEQAVNMGFKGKDGAVSVGATQKFSDLVKIEEALPDTDIHDESAHTTNTWIDGFDQKHFHSLTGTTHNEEEFTPAPLHLQCCGTLF
jgi:hypothetical protein